MPKLGSSKISIGAKFKNKKDLEFEILELISEEIRNNESGRKIVRNYKIRFLKSGYECIKESSTILKGDIKDNLQYDILDGKACFGYGDIHKNHTKEIYRNYHSLLRRIYDPKSAAYNRYGKLGVKICDRWHRYDYFLDDLDRIPNFNKEKYSNGELQLDKDILQQNIPNNKKIYSLETCTFITPSENLKDASNRKGIKEIKVTNINDNISFIFKGKIKDLANKLNVDLGCLNKCLRGIYSSTKGYSFELLKEII